MCRAGLRVSAVTEYFCYRECLSITVALTTTKPIILRSCSSLQALTHMTPRDRYDPPLCSCWWDELGM